MDLGSQSDARAISSPVDLVTKGLALLEVFPLSTLFYYYYFYVLF